MCLRSAAAKWLAGVCRGSASLRLRKALFILTYMPLALLGDPPELIFETDAVYGPS